MSIGSFISRVVPTAIGYATGGPIGAARAFSEVEAQKRAEKQAKRELNAFNDAMKTREQQRMAIGLDAFGGQGRPINTPAVSTANSGGGFFDTIRGGIREIGGLAQDFFSFAQIPQLFDRRTPSVSQQPAITTTSRVGAQESQGSGTIQAGMGVALPAIISGARNLLKSPGGQLAVGGGALAASSFISGDGQKMRITRKMKSQARTVLNIAGGNLSVAADILNISEEMLVTILLKRFRNDGPVVTKAALRKTKQTIRRLHSMQDVLKSITPTATMRRRAPMKRATTTTLIKN